MDLFAGCGGMTRGFVQAGGFTPVMAVESDTGAAASYAANFGPEHIHCGDIADIADSSIPRADVVIGGPPCQGFSNLGTRDVEDPRNKLWKQFIRFVRQARPRAFVIENVDRFHRSPDFALLGAESEPGGLLQDYELVSDVLSAADFGVAQRRRRTIVIGSRVGRIPMPTRTHDEDATGDTPARWRTVREAIGDVPRTPIGTELPNARVEFFGTTVPGIFKAAELHLGRRPTRLSLRRYDCVPPGGGRFDLPDELLSACWRNKSSGTTDVMGRMRWERPSHTIRTEFYKPEKGQYLHPQWDPEDPSLRVNRPITHWEAARLQSFSDEFLWCGSKISIARQIGNAVPPGLAEAIANHLKSFLS